MKTGIELIAEERARQISEENWTPDHDAGHVNGELAMAAAVYACPEYSSPAYYSDDSSTSLRSRLFHWLWPFGITWYKPASRPYRQGPHPAERVKELTKAGALIAAEIDRLQSL